ncbi:MAG: hypothetical protein ACFFDN_42335 [Candidatus Hodarchaeota archaeon]
MWNFSFSLQKKNMLFIGIYILGISILLFSVEYYTEFLYGNALALIGFTYFVYYFSKNDLKNQYLTNFYFISLLFFWVRFPFILKPNSQVDFIAIYHLAVRMADNFAPIFDFNLRYGPVFSLFLAVPTLLTNGDFFAIRFFFLLIDYCNLVLIYLIARHLQFKNRYKILILYILMPFLITKFSWQCHNDVGVVLLMLISFYCLIREQLIFSSCFITLAIAYKYFAVFVYPIFLIYLYKIKKPDENYFIKIIKFISPVIIFAGVLLLFSSDMLISIIRGFYESAFVFHGAHIPRRSLMASILRITEGPNLAIMTGSLAKRFKLRLDNSITFLLVLITVNFLMSYNIKEKHLKIILFSLNAIFVVLFFIFPIINPLIWLFISGIVLLITLRYDSNTKRSDWQKGLIIFSIFALFFYPAMLLILQRDYYTLVSLFPEAVQNVLMISLFCFLFINYYIFYKIKENHVNTLLFFVFFTILIFLAFFWSVTQSYFLWIVPFILLLFNKDKLSNFFVIFLPIYSASVYSLRIEDFNGFSKFFTNLFSNVPFQISLIAILTIINIIVSIKILKQNFLNDQISRVHLIIIIALWCVIAILIVNIPLNILINRVTWDCNVLYLVNQYYNYLGEKSLPLNNLDIYLILFIETLFNLLNQLKYIYLIEFILTIIIILFFVDKYLLKYLEVKEEESPYLDYIRMFRPAIVTILLIFFINSLPFMYSNFLQLPFGLISLSMLSFFIIKGLNSHKILPKESEISSKTLKPFLKNDNEY